MIKNTALEYEKKYVPYAIFDKNGKITGFKEGTPKEALLAAKSHIEMSARFDDVSNLCYWHKKLNDLGLNNV